MNDIRRAILWAVFGVSLILLWDQWQIHNGQVSTFFPAPVATVQNPTTQATPTASSAPVNAGSAAAVPAVSASQAGQAVSPSASIAKQSVVVSSDVLRLTVDTEGGTVVKSEFLKYPDTADKTKPFVLLDNSAERVYLAKTGLIGKDQNYPQHTTLMTVTSGEHVLGDGENEVSLRLESPTVGGLKLVKTYTLHRGAYDISVRHDITNTSASMLPVQLYQQLQRDGNKPAGESSFYSTFTGAAVYSDEKKYQKFVFSDIEKNKADYEKHASDGYIAMVQHYFVSVWILPNGSKHENILRKDGNNLYSVSNATDPEMLAPGQTKTVESKLFIGPQVETKLEAMTPGLELVKDYGWFTILAKPLYWFLAKLHSMLGNWGWSIVALVLLLKAAFYPLNAKAYSSMAKMKAINPKITDMRERLKDKPQEMQQAMMKMYREEKVNPMGGCFPMLIQIPVFIALYNVLLSSVEMRGAPWALWIHDLSVPDPFFILPAVMTATSMFQTWLNPTPPDPMQAKMMWIMPLAFSVMFFFFPAGLVLYWITNNVLSIAQQWFINKRLGVLGK